MKTTLFKHGCLSDKIGKKLPVIRTYSNLTEDVVIPVMDADEANIVALIDDVRSSARDGYHVKQVDVVFMLDARSTTIHPKYRQGLLVIPPDTQHISDYIQDRAQEGGRRLHTVTSAAAQAHYYGPCGQRWSFHAKRTHLTTSIFTANDACLNSVEPAWSRFAVPLKHTNKITMYYDTRPTEEIEPCISWDIRDYGKVKQGNRNVDFTPLYVDEFMAWQPVIRNICETVQRQLTFK